MKKGREVIKLSSLSEGVVDCIEHQDSSPEEGWEIVDAGEWIADHKYQHRTTVYKHKDRFWAYSESRSGSPFTDYHYDDTTELFEVFPVTRTITVYE